MARKKLESVDVDLDDRPTRPVKVSTVTREEYIREEPADVEIETEAEDATWSDPFASFNEIISTSQNAVLRIWRLPNYDLDGQTAIRGTEREYCGSVPYSTDNAVLLDQIQARVPMGGMVSLELFADAAVRKRGLLKLVKYPQNQQQQTSPSNPSFIINQPTPPVPVVAPVNPAEVMREHMRLAQDLVQMARDLQPGQPEGPQQMSAPPPFEDRLFETVLTKALDSDKAPIDKVLDALSGRRAVEPGWAETLMPLAIEAMRLFAPAINAFSQRLAQAPVQGATAAAGASLQQPTAQLGPAVETVPDSAPDVNNQPPPPVVDPIQRDWQQAMIRMLEDCTRHVELMSVGGGSKSVIPASESILELYSRYPEQLAQTIAMLLTQSPDQVLDLCCMMLNESGVAHVNSVLKPAESAKKWIEELQGETKRIIEEAQTETDEVDADEK